MAPQGPELRCTKFLDKAVSRLKPIVETAQEYWALLFLFFTYVPEKYSFERIDRH